VTLRDFCPIFPGITSPRTESQLRCGCLSADGKINFAAVCLIIKSLVEMYHQHAVCDGPRMLRTWLIVCCPRG